MFIVSSCEIWGVIQQQITNTLTDVLKDTFQSKMQQLLSIRHFHFSYGIILVRSLLSKFVLGF